jgi:hypothetical protein
MFRSQSYDHHQGVNHLTCASVTYRRAYVHSQTPQGKVHRTHRNTDNIRPQTGI